MALMAILHLSVNFKELNQFIFESKFPPRTIYFGVCNVEYILPFNYYRSPAVMKDESLDGHPYFRSYEYNSMDYKIPCIK